MKIIRQGEYHGPETQPHTFECKRCGCIWEAAPEEYQVATQYGGDCIATLDITCRCPVCDAVIYANK